MGEKQEKARSLITKLKNGCINQMYADAQKQWTEKYEMDDVSIRLLVNCLKTCKEEDRYGYALALVNNINSLYSASVRYIHIHEVAKNVVTALFCNTDNPIGTIAGSYTYGKTYFSFATKLCTFYYDNEYVMYDSYLDNFIWNYVNKFDLTNKDGEKIYHHSFDPSAKDQTGRYESYHTAWEMVYDHFIENFAAPADIKMTKKDFDIFVWTLMKLN